MTHAEKILQAAAQLVTPEGSGTFTRVDVRDRIGLNAVEWAQGYTSIFQGMRVDQPGGAPSVNSEFRDLFRRTGRGTYELTNAGKAAVAKLRKP